MASSGKFSEVPVVNITANNIKELWPSLVLAMKTSTFVALDVTLQETDRSIFHSQTASRKAFAVETESGIWNELSGLGDRALLGVKSLPDRYTNLCEVAKTRSILSLGLSCFKLKKVEQVIPSEDDPEIKQWMFSVQTFNVLLLCSEDFVVEPGSLKFLLEHGFDFNKQFSAGVAYYRGKEKTEKDSKELCIPSGPTARQIFDILLWCEVPIVLHNGFIDLIFLYQNFYTDLPSTLQVFLADLAEMFPHGILDTKYAVEFVDRLPATYLEYVFRKWHRSNNFQVSTERREVCLEFVHLPTNPSYVTYSRCNLPTTCVELGFIPKTAVLQDLICQSFAGHGWCSKGKKCPKSHAIDLILDLHGIKAAKRRKRRRRRREAQKKQQSSEEEKYEFSAMNYYGCKRVLLNPASTEEHRAFSHDDDHSNSSVEDVSVTSVHHDSDSGVLDYDEDEVDYDTITDTYLKKSFQLEKGRSGGHRAGFDAFMTGFIMACILSKHTSAYVGEKVLGAGIKLGQLSGAGVMKDRIYAMGKDQGLIVSKSNFCSTSKNHRERKQHLKKP